MWPDSLSQFGLLRPWWLLLLPLAYWLCWRLYRHKGGRSGWETLLPPHLRTALLQRHPGGSHGRRYLLLALVWTVAILALSGPARERAVEAPSPDQQALVIVLDLSRHMLATDLTPNRLTRAQHKIQDIIRHNPEQQIALIVYAGSSHLVTPLSRDRNTLNNLLASLQPNIMPSDGRQPDQALSLATNMLAGLPPRSTQVLLMTSGLEGETLKQLEQHARELGSRLAILGIGTSTGSPVPLSGGGFMRDAQGSILLPRLDAQSLASIARRYGGGYHGITLDDSDLDHLLRTLSIRSANIDTEPSQHLTDLGHWLLLLLLPLAALGARRGWFGLLLCAMLLPNLSEAASWRGLWWTADQQASKLLESDAAQAAELFDDPAWKAWAWYQAGDYSRAAAQYAELITQWPDNPEYHFNHGTALAMAERYEEALDAYEQVLTRVPEHQAARHNRSRIEAWLEAQQQDAESSTEQDQTPAKAEPEPGEPSVGPSQGSGADHDTDNALAETETSPAGGVSPGSGGSPGEQISDAGSAPGDAASPTAGNQQPANDIGSTAPGWRESEQALQLWLNDLPDDPGELLRRKFLYQHLQRQDAGFDDSP